MSNSNTRATTIDISGRERYEIIKSVISRYNTAMEHRFFLEATALMESLICDRLESRLGELTNSPVKFSTIGKLLQDLNKVESDPILKQIMNTKFNGWSGQRNKTIHRAAKIEMGEKKDWDKFLLMAESTAKTGKEFFYAYSTQLNNLRKQSNK